MFLEREFKMLGEQSNRYRYDDVIHPNNKEFQLGLLANKKAPKFIINESMIDSWTRHNLLGMGLDM